MIEFPKISIIVPIYNAEQYLDQCIRSVVSQTYQNLEIILVNDGSTDTSHIICERWAQKDSRIVHLDTKNCGVSSARNKGISYSQGEFLAFVDADDKIASTYIEVLYKTMLRTNADMVFSSSLTFEADDEITEEIGAVNVPAYYEFENGAVNTSKCLGQYDLNTSWNKLFKKKLFQKFLFPENMEYGEDLYVIVNILKCHPKVTYVPVKLYFYRKNFESVSYNMGIKKCMDGLDAVMSIFVFSKQRGLPAKKYFDWCFGAYTRAYRAKDATKRDKVSLRTSYLCFFFKNWTTSFIQAKCWLFLFSPLLYSKIKNL